MTIKPTTLTPWDSTQVNAVVPDATHQSEGWLEPAGVPEKPPFQTFNYMMNQYYLWMLFVQNSLSITRGYIDGLIASNDAGDTDHDIAIANGAASLIDGAGNYNIFELTTALVKQIDAVWSEGTDAGGRASGVALTVDTHYYLFLIAKDDGTIDAGFDTDVDATNLLADATDYTWYRHIMDVITNSSSNIFDFVQYVNAVVILDDEILDIDDAVGTIDVFQTGTTSVPPNTYGLFRGLGEASAANEVGFSLKSVGGSAVVTQSNRDAADSTVRRGAGSVQFPVDSNRQIQYTISGDGTWAEFRLRTSGFISNRGKDLE